MGVGQMMLRCSRPDEIKVLFPPQGGNACEIIRTHRRVPAVVPAIFMGGYNGGNVRISAGYSPFVPSFFSKEKEEGEREEYRGFARAWKQGTAGTRSDTNIAFFWREDGSEG